MKHNVVLTITSLLSIVFLSFHQADDIVRGMSPGGLGNLIALPIFVVLLYGTLMLPDRRSGLVIMLLGSLVAAAMPAIHMRGAGVGFGTVRSSGLFFVWLLFALGATGSLGFILAARGLWNLRRGQPR